MDFIKEVIFVIKQRGLFAFSQLVIAYAIDLLFDKRFGTDTSSWARIEDLSIDSINVNKAEMYQVTRFLPLRKLIISQHFPNNSVFIDLGCGKGRALIIAAQCGIKKLRGVEFSPELCQIAKENIRLYQEKTGNSADFNVSETDVVNYVIQPDENIFFLFNPFDDEIIAKVLQNLSNNLNDHPRKLWIIYHNPVYKQAIDASGLFFPIKDVTYWGSRFVIYQNRQ